MSKFTTHKEIMEQFHDYMHKKSEGRVPHKAGGFTDWAFGFFAERILNIEEQMKEIRLNKEDTSSLFAKLNRVEDIMREVSKQQKYLWQTLTETNELKLLGDAGVKSQEKTE